MYSTYRYNVPKRSQVDLYIQVKPGPLYSGEPFNQKIWQLPDSSIEEGSWIKGQAPIEGQITDSIVVSFY